KPASAGPMRNPAVWTICIRALAASRSSLSGTMSGSTAFCAGKKKRLHVHAVHVEPGVAMNDGNGRALAAAVGELAQFLAAKTIAYGKNIPSGWQTCLK
ncbi:MAG: hypothetical protein ACE5EY_16525, partial [Anaerolineae bacterium]